MKLLSLDTSDNFVSVAVLSEDKVLSSFCEQMERGQAECLIPVISDTLLKAGVDMKDLDAIAVSVGPGSFTGVRIGLATARGLGLALDKPVWGVTCFEMAAFGIDEKIKVALDTRRGDYYVQTFENGLPVDEPSILSSDDMKQSLPFACAGNGAEQIKQDIGCQVVLSTQTPAVAIGKIALSRQNNPLPALPLYLREADVSI